MTKSSLMNFNPKSTGGQALSFVSQRVLALALVIAAVLSFTPEKSQAGMIATTETKVEYAKSLIGNVLAPNFVLYPGSIQIEERVEKVADLGGMARSLFGRERNELVVTFKAMDRSESLFEGRSYLTISAVSKTADDLSQDNNTTRYFRDIGTDRYLKVQLFDHENYVKTITLKDLNLKMIGAR